MGVDPKKFETVKSCLEASFKDVWLDTSNQRFVFNDGKQSSELIFNRAFIDDITESRLKSHMVKDIVPTLKANPGRRISVSAGGIGIGKRDSQ
jgi:hypothetical protein